MSPSRNVQHHPHQHSSLYSPNAAASSYRKCSFRQLCSRALTANSEWPDKDEFLDVIYWSRQVFGILLGAVWGFIPLKGFIGIMLFASISCCLVYLYSINFQNIDEDAYGGAWELVKEGFMTSFAGFLVTWIIFYTGLHYDAIMAAKMTINDINIGAGSSGSGAHINSNSNLL